MFWILLSFRETRKQEFLPRIRHYNFAFLPRIRRSCREFDINNSPHFTLVTAVTNPTWMSHCWDKPGPWYHCHSTNASAAASKPFSRWVSMLGPLTCAEPDAGSRRDQNSATELRNVPRAHQPGTSCAHISVR